MTPERNAADRWHPQLHVIKALLKLAKMATDRHVDTQDCGMTEEIAAVWEALQITEEKLQQVIDELTEEGGHYRLVEKQPATT